MIDDDKNISQVCSFIDTYVMSDRELFSAHIENIKCRIKESIMEKGGPDRDILLKRL